MSRSFILLILVIIFLLTGCLMDKGTTYISVERTPFVEPTLPKVTPKPTIEITRAPTHSPEPTVDVGFDILDELELIDSLYTLFVGKWIINEGQFEFTMNDKVYTNGIGMFVESKNIIDEEGSLTATWKLEKEYMRITFDMGCEQTMQYDDEDKYGIYKVEIIADDEVLWDSDYHDYQFVLENQEIILSEVYEKLEIKLTQQKGKNGTLNVILGDFKLHTIP